MERTIAATPAESILHGALELSKNTWLLGIQFPDRPQPSLYPIRGGNTEDLMTKLTAARDRCAKLSGLSGSCHHPKAAAFRCTVGKMSPILPARLSVHAAEWQAGTELPDIS